MDMVQCNDTDDSNGVAGQGNIMVQVIYEHTIDWPEQGTLTVKAPPVEGEIAVSPDSARKRANGYLARYVGLALEAGEPVLVLGPNPLWRMPVFLTLRGWGQVVTLGTITIDATTRAVVPFSSNQIKEMQDRADAIAARLTQTPT